jgi:phosphohistidine phosphatase
MRRLILLRHAEAVVFAQQGDRERALSERGRRDAVFVGEYLSSEHLLPDMVLLSPARRTRETFEPIKIALPDVAMQEEPHIYNALPEHLLDLIQAAPLPVKTLMMVGHNPGFEDVARELIGFGDRYAHARLAQGFQTAGLVVIDFSVEAWSDPLSRKGRLDRYVTPVQ